MILCGHPTGNPNSHHAALAYYESGRLEAFCVPWMPSAAELAALRALARCGARRNLVEQVERLGRRRFPALAPAPKVQDRVGEWQRLLRRMSKRAVDNDEANQWLMATMARETKRTTVTAVHSFEDCSLRQFEEAKRLGKICIYDMPIGYYPWWEEKQKQLARDFADWVPVGGLPSSRYVRPEQKICEMELADLVLVPSHFVEKTIREFWPEKKIALAPYGVDGEFWCPAEGGQQGAGSREHGVGSGERGAGRGERALQHDGLTGRRDGGNSLLVTSDSRPATALRFIYAGGCSIRKGIPVLLEAWEKAQLRDAELLLVGSWQLADSKLKELPRGVKFLGPVGPEQLRELYRESDVFVFPSFFEGFGLVILEAMACGLPVIASECSAGPDVLDDSCGRVIKAGEPEQLIESLRWFTANPDRLPAMKAVARYRAEGFTWGRYRAAVNAATLTMAGRYKS
jgi:glycosyltransferase involved in cell wall biosynthesis